MGVRADKRTIEAGFSLLETIVVVSIVMIMATVVSMQYRSTLDLLDADVAIGEITSQMRYARQVSLDQRRVVRIDFVAPSTIRVVRINGIDDTTVMSEIDLPGAFAFAIPASAAGTDTPDLFGNTSAIDFGLDGADPRIGGTFLPDGTFVDEDNSLLNGTVFTMGGSEQTARAATLAGSTGRVRQFRWTGGLWEAQ
jgi:type II secretory pathway pseudopilin PulG